MVISLNFITTKGQCNQKIVLFGDSLMSGYGLEKKFHLSSILEENLKNSIESVNIVNSVKNYLVGSFLN